MTNRVIFYTAGVRLCITNGCLGGDFGFFRALEVATQGTWDLVHHHSGHTALVVFSGMHYRICKDF